jgi:hypothetical protein
MRLVRRLTKRWTRQGVSTIRTFAGFRIYYMLEGFLLSKYESLDETDQKRIRQLHNTLYYIHLQRKKPSS